MNGPARPLRNCPWTVATKYFELYVSSLPLEGGNRSSLQNVVFYLLEYRTTENVQKNPAILVIYSVPSLWPRYNQMLILLNWICLLFGPPRVNLIPFIFWKKKFGVAPWIMIHVYWYPVSKWDTRPFTACKSFKRKSLTVLVSQRKRDCTCRYAHSTKPTNSGAWSASELYRPSHRRLSAKLVPTLADRGRRVVSATNPQPVNFGFLDRSRYLPFK
jgi:hypothetical protein